MMMKTRVGSWNGFLGRLLLTSWVGAALIVGSSMVSCTPIEPSNADGETVANQWQDELAMKEKELALRERELALKEEQLNQTSEPVSPESLPELYKRLRTSVYMVITSNDTSQSQGTAFTIDRSGVALSNYHVFKSASKAVVINENGDHFMIAEVIHQDSVKDFIKFRISPGNEFEHFKIASASPVIGDVCYTIGNPEGYTHTLSSGLVSGYRYNNEMIQTTTPITHGSSGGPLFNAVGEVTGITTSGMGEGNLNFALNIQEVLAVRNQVEATAPTKELGKVSCKELITNYYRALEGENYDLLRTFYAPVLYKAF
ncbi:MAG: serine protease [Flavobacteriales bacterium]|nr:serine protease [Flavobacteriales bacterium]